MRCRVRLISLVAGLLLAACAGDDPADRAPATNGAGGEAGAPLPAGAEARSLLGEPLFPPELSDAVRESHEQNLQAARVDLDADPTDADAMIWYGRRLAYLGRYAEAIEVYTQGIAEHPRDARFLRHRGHRHLSTRNLDAAIADLRAAAELVRGLDDEVEPDGLPNALDIPTSTLHFNIWYHLGLAHYLKGEFEQALLAWNDCLDVSRHPDSVVATVYWLNTTLRRLGLVGQAEALLEDITPDMGIIESTAYLDVLLLYKGERTPEQLLGPTGADATLASTTTAYGVALWHLTHGRHDTAHALLEAILTNHSQWPAFGYLAAEAEVARAAGLPGS